MSPFNTILFVLFVLPAVIIRKGFEMLTKNMTKKDKIKWLWRIPYALIIILVILIVILWMNGYR
jgi:chromate transport protein ChrA